MGCKKKENTENLVRDLFTGSRIDFLGRLSTDCAWLFLKAPPHAYWKAR